MRGIKPTFFVDRTIATLPFCTRLTFIGLWTYVDDSGRAENDAVLVKYALWPFDARHGVTRVKHDLQLLADAGRICLYDSDPTEPGANGQVKHYLHIVHWEHQNINRPQRSVIPHCTITEHSLNDHCAVSDESVLKGSRSRSRKGSEGESVNGDGRAATTWQPSPMEENHNQREPRRAFASGTGVLPNWTRGES